MRLQKLYSGDYQGEFGFRMPSPWSVHYIIDGQEIVGECEISINDSTRKNLFRATTKSAGYLGKFDTRQQMYEAVKANVPNAEVVKSRMLLAKCFRIDPQLTEAQKAISG